jgi:hypothetical protein
MVNGPVLDLSYLFQVPASLRLLTITSIANPRIAPITIDSHGNPGIGGSTKLLPLDVVVCAVAVLVRAPVSTELLEISEVEVMN